MIARNLFVRVVYHGKYLIRQKIRIIPNMKYEKIDPKIIPIMAKALKDAEEEMRYSVY